MIVVADSTIIVALSKAGRLDILRDLYGEVTMPPEVHRETVARGLGRHGTNSIAQAQDDGWLTITPVRQVSRVDWVRGKYPEV